METLLYINSNIDTHTDYTKTRVADQAGNFIINGQHEYSSDYKFRTGNKKTGNSLKFPSSETLHINDHYNVFNFGPRDFSIRTWIKFNKPTENSNLLFSKNVILSKWSDNFESTETNKVFRYSYVRNNLNPEKSYISFEYAGPKGYHNENFPHINIIGTSSGMYDGSYSKVTEKIVSDEFDKNFHVWQKHSDDDDNSDLLVMRKRNDPLEFDSIGESDMEIFRKNNLLGDYGFLNWIANGDNSEDWKTSESPYQIETPTKGNSSFTNESEISATAGEYVFSFSTSFDNLNNEFGGDFKVYVLNRKISKSSDITDTDIVIKKNKNEIAFGQNNFYFKLDQAIDGLYILFEFEGGSVSSQPPIKVSGCSLKVRNELNKINNDEFFILKYEQGNYNESNLSENISKFVEVGHHHKMECGDLNDGKWHYLYVSCFYEHDFVKNDAIAKIQLGVDEMFLMENRIREDVSPTVKYVDNKDGTSDRELYLSAISPHFEKTTNGEYNTKLSMQNVIIGSDLVNSENDLLGNIDTLIIGEYTDHEDETSYKAFPKNIQPKCVVDALAKSIVGFYDDDTEYYINELDKPENMDIKIFEPTHADEANLSTSLSIYKKQIGNMEYLSSVWNGNRDITQEDLDKWKWELKFMSPPNFLIYTEEEMSEWEQSNSQKEALL